MMLVHLVSELANLLPMTRHGRAARRGQARQGGQLGHLDRLSPICVLGILIAGAMMAVGQRRGEGGEHAARLGWVLAACIVIGSASALVGRAEVTLGTIDLRVGG